MYLKDLEITNFRNYQSEHLDFSPQVNILLGKNAQGKTNLLEAIYFLAMARSHRTSNDRELINFKKDSSLLKGVVQKKINYTKLELLLSKKGKKVKVDYLEKAKLSDYIGQLNVILFAPEDLLLVKGAPSLRRKFIDMEFGQISPRYLHNLTQYRMVLKQKNQYLKQLSTKKVNDTLYLDVLSEQLSQLGGLIIYERLIFLQKLEKFAQQLHQKITQEQEKLTFKYESSVKIDNDMSIKEIQERLYQLFLNNKEKEIFQGTTLYGPHRDDVKFLVNDRNVQIYGSQGQQRTTALSVKLAEIDVMKEKTGEYPVLLLDDVLSELDGQRQTHLLTTIQNKVQTFLTTPGLSDVAKELIKNPKIFKIENGHITKILEDNLPTIIFDQYGNETIIYN